MITERSFDRSIKRIISGVTYNTETATEVAGVVGEALFKTRYGSYFIAYENSERECDRGLSPISREEARTWLKTHYRRELPPWTSNAERRITLRMPTTLGIQIDALAKSNDQSTNAWIIRCLERCVRAQGTN